MYLIGIKDGVHPCGNTGTLITHYITEHKLRETARRFAAMYDLSEVYGLQTYPQTLCEMNNAEFTKYIRRNSKRYI